MGMTEDFQKWGGNNPRIFKTALEYSVAFTDICNPFSEGLKLS